MIFRDRRHAGVLLGEALAGLAAGPPALVLALPRGGVPVGFETARALGAELDVYLVRKLGAPGQPELAMGALAEDGTRVLNDIVIAKLGIGAEELEEAARRETKELVRRRGLYRGRRPAAAVAGRDVVLVDDGLATGMTMQAAARAVRRAGPARLTAAVPVGSVPACAALSRLVDEVICLVRPEPFGGVGDWYEDFDQTSDDEVRSLLARARLRRGTAA